jgi:hypothetical protein
VLIRSLPPEAALWTVIAEQAEKSLTSVERNRARAEHYRKLAEEAK